MKNKIYLTVLCGLVSLSLGAQEMERIKIHGYAQGGYNVQNNGENVSNSFVIKRTIAWVDADITKRWSFRFMHDFNSVVQEYYTEFKVDNNNLFNIRFGQAKTGLTYENPLSPTSLETIDIYSEGVTYLAGCGSDPLNGVQYGRDLGLAVFGETSNKFLRYELDVVNGTGINVSDNDNCKNIIGRVELRPVEGLNICFTGQYGKGKALVDRSMFNPDLRVGEIYVRNRLSAGLAYSSGRLDLHGEYLQGLDGKVTSRGAYLTGSFSIIPKTLDVVASADYFNFNTSIQGADMTKAVAGLQYWFFPKCRAQIQYVFKNAYTDYRSFFTRTPVNMIMCQIQVRFN